MTWQVFGRFGGVVWRGKAASAAEAKEKAVRANKVRWLDVTEVSRVPGAAKRNVRGVRSNPILTDAGTRAFAAYAEKREKLAEAVDSAQAAYRKARGKAGKSADRTVAERRAIARLYKKWMAAQAAFDANETAFQAASEAAEAAGASWLTPWDPEDDDRVRTNARSARSVQDNPSPFRVGARVQDEYGNVGTVVHVPTSRGGSYHVDMDGDGQRPLSAGRALLLRSEIRAAPKVRAAKRAQDWTKEGAKYVLRARVQSPAPPINVYDMRYVVYKDGRGPWRVMTEYTVVDGHDKGATGSNMLARATSLRAAKAEVMWWIQHGTKTNPTLRRNDASARLRTSKPRASASLTELKRIYTDHHWGEKPTKVFKIKDPVVPKGVVAMGRLEELDVAGVGPVAFPDAPDGQADLSCAWIGWDPKHPRKRLYIILPAEIREKFRNMMKHAEKTETLAQIAKRAGGAHAKYRYPNIKAAAIGRLKSETYRIIKKGDGWSSYIHEHGEDGMGGTKPVLAMDVSGRLWFCGGDYSVKEAGIVG